MDDQSAKRNLVLQGMVLILLGLLTGFTISNTRNPRVAMASHVEALMGGMLLLTIGGIAWDYAQLGKRGARIVQLLLFYSSYANWFFLLLSAVWGTGKMLPIAAKGYRGTDFQELICSAGLGSSALAILCAMITLLVGIRNKTVNSKPQHSQATERNAPARSE